jgi:hydrogenase maturation protease
MNEQLPLAVSRVGKRCLLIGYGNELRRDDGVGPAVARTVEGWCLEGVQTLAVHQLTPELAECMAAVETVMFVDASVTGRTVCLRRLDPAATATPLGHRSDPCQLLALTALLYGCRPDTWLLTIPVADLGMGVGFSPSARNGIPITLRLVRKLLQEWETVGGQWRSQRDEWLLAPPQ